MQTSYNKEGQLVSEKWHDGDNNLKAHYKYVYDGQGNIVRSVDIFSNKEYNYTYEDGRIMRATESTIVLNSSEMVIRKTLVNSIFYSYDENGRQTKKRVIPASGSERVTEYEYPSDSAQVSRFSVGERMITSHSKTDSFGRKVFDELQLGSGVLSRQYSYHTGEYTDEHQENEKIKSSAVTQLVREVVFADGRTLSYEYDAEERITKVVDSETGTTEYTYDALGQLLTEKVNDVTTGYAYDNYGNIIEKGVCDENGNITEATKHTYTYGANAWKDLLTAYDGQSITYDIQGNPTGYMGHSLTWEKGRQLKSFDANTYTYNANGIRTSKTVNGVKHTYMLEGTKILRETWGANTLIPLYDCEDSICGILYNNAPYYFRKNLQGDVIAVTDADANDVCGYSYDAWGVCTVTYDTSGAGIGEINPYRYRSYYYDSEIGMYYLQSRYYDPIIGRYIIFDEIETVCLNTDSLTPNVFIYCKNNHVNEKDETGMFSFSDLFSKISSFIQRLFQRFMDNLKKQIQITSKYIKISITVIKLVLDLAITIVVNKFLKWSIEKIIGIVMKKYIKKSTNSFVEFLGKVLSHSATKWLIKALILRAMNLGYVRSTSNALKSIFIDSIIPSSLDINRILPVTLIISRINSISAACSSVSGFIAFILDLADRKWDDYLTIRFT